MTNGDLSAKALDVLNRRREMREAVGFCGKGGIFEKEMGKFADWLIRHLRRELPLEDWIVEPKYEGGVNLFLFQPNWRFSRDEYIAFYFWWLNPFVADPIDPEGAPCVQLYIPDAKTFPARKDLLKQILPILKQTGFTDHWEHDDVPDPSGPLWRYIRLEEFQRESGFDLDAFVSEIVADFRRLLATEPLIQAAVQSSPKKPVPPPAERKLQIIAILDTESDESDGSRKMTQLGVVIVGYDPTEDKVVGVLDEYFKKPKEKLDTEKVRRLLEGAEFIVAHNTGADKPLVELAVPGSEKMQWLCSLHGIDWKKLCGVQNKKLETLLGKFGLSYTQKHNALADARDLRDLLAHSSNGRTHLGRLLDRAGAK